MTSDMISQQIGAFQAQSMGQMQHASMLSQHVGAGHMASGMMGSMVNTAAAVGAPAAGLGLAIAGLDPLSLGIRAGGLVGGAKGLGMGLGAGIGAGAMAAGAMMLPIQAAQWAGGQMLTGMQQQQGLDEMIRQTYGASGTLNRGGFSAGQMGQIGGMMRQMAGTFGPQHQMTTFGELTQLMQGMSQMGMMPRAGATGPNLQEFTTRFRAMLKEVKEVAHAFNTTLTEAQEMMGSMRQSGVFRNQGAVAREMKNWALSGGLATTEVASMMNIGSQISRSIGGRGLAGAMGGMRTIGQIGIANQMGIISEEDIYNTTGLTGAEGRQAYAMQQMQQSAEFLRGGLGRRFMASMAGKNGQIDPTSAMQWMAGGMSTGETMGSAQANLAKVGRANFIRNEAKMRGAVLAQFGGMADIMAASSWLEGRGISMDDDRANIWLQRRMGWTEEQAEQKLRIMRRLPEIQQQAMIAGEETELQARHEERRSRIGVRGVKRKLEEFRHKVSNNLQQAGSDVYKWGENLLERWINGLTDEYYQTISRDVGEAVHALASGTPGQAEEASRRLGLSGRGATATAFLTKAAERVYGGSLLTEGARGERTLARFKETDQARFKEAGYWVGTRDVGEMRAGIERAQQFSNAALRGADVPEFREVGAGASEHIRNLVTSGRFIGRGEDLLRVMRDSFSKAPSVPGWSRLRAAAEKLKGPEGAARAADILRGAGVSEEFIRASFAAPDVRSLESEFGGARTEEDAARILGDYALKDLYKGGAGGGIREGETGRDFVARQAREKAEFNERVDRETHEEMVRRYGGSVNLQRQQEIARRTRLTAQYKGGAGSKQRLDEALKSTAATDREFRTEKAWWDWRENAGKPYEQIRAEVAQRIRDEGVVGGFGATGQALIGAGRAEVASAFGRYVMGEEGQRLLRGALSESAVDREAAKTEADAISQRIQAEHKRRGGDMSADMRAQLMAARSVSSASRLLELQKKESEGTLTDADKRGFEDEFKVKYQDAKNTLEAGGAALYKQERADQAEAQRRLGIRGAQTMAQLSESKLVGSAGMLNEAGLKIFEKVGKAGAYVGTGEAGLTTGQTAAGMFVEAQKLFAAGKVEEGRKTLAGEFESFAGMSVAEQRAYAQGLMQLGGAGAERGMMLGQLSKQGQRLAMYGQRGRAGEGVARGLGMEVSPELQRMLYGKGGEAAADLIMAQRGITAENLGPGGAGMVQDYRNQLLKAQKLAGEGKGVEAQAILQGLRGGQAEKAVEAKQKQEQAEQDPSYQVMARMAGTMRSIEAKLNSGLIVKVGNVPLTTKDQSNKVEGSTKCLREGTQISMADGTSKPIEDVLVGDEVLTANMASGKVEPATVVATYHHEVNTDLITIDGVVSTTNHPYFVNDEEVLSENVSARTKLYKLESGKLVPTRVHMITRTPLAECGGVTVYAIHVSKNRNYFAGGFLVSQEC